MKVMFIGVGVVHYFNLVLNHLNSNNNIEIVNLIPSNTKGHLQEGVFQTTENTLFNIAVLKEYTIPPLYHSFHGICRLLYREKPDIIVTTEFYLPAFVLNPLLFLTVKCLGIKIILKSIPFRIFPYKEAKENIAAGIYHGNNTSSYLNLLSYFPRILKSLRILQLEINRYMYRFPDAHVNYISAAQNIFKSYGIKQEKIFITYNSPDTDYLFRIKKLIEKTPSILKPCNHRIIHVGRLVQWKRVDLLITAFSIVRKIFPDAELVVVGDGPEKQSLSNLAHKLNIQDSVRFVGGIYDAPTLGKYLLCSSVYALAGMGGLSINDAMCFGLPVICSECDGTEKHLVREGYNGLFFKNGDNNDLSDKIVYLLKNEKLRQQMGQNSIQIIKDEINIHRVVQGYISAFNYVLEN